jgi:hypothetical protein
MSYLNVGSLRDVASATVLYQKGSLGPEGRGGGTPTARTSTSRSLTIGWPNTPRTT